MRMITRCPACGTAFRVYQAQLDARQGQVRCGHCAVVFNAHTHLSLESETAAGAGTSTLATSPADTREVQPEIETAQGHVSEPQSTDDGTPGAGQATANTAKPGAEDRAVSEEDASSSSGDERDPVAAMAATEATADTALAAPAAAPQAASEATATSVEESEAETADESAEAAAPAAAQTVSRDESDDFPLMSEGSTLPNLMAPVQSNAEGSDSATLDETDISSYGFRTRTPLSRTSLVLWSFAAALLLCGLFVQCVYLWRTEITQALPSLRPPLERACALVGCTVPYPREIEFISIESSELQAAPGARDVLVLSAVLRNRATFAQTYPAIELTLTGEADTTVARRVLRPRDYLSESRSEQAAMAAASELPLQLHIDAAGLGASGYRLRLLYP